MFSFIQLGINIVLLNLSYEALIHTLDTTLTYRHINLRKWKLSSVSTCVSVVSVSDTSLRICG